MAEKIRANFLPGFYSKLGDAISLGLKVRGIRYGSVNSRDINAAVMAGERMNTNMIAADALESGDQETIANLVTVETGVHPVKVEQPSEVSFSPDSIKALSAATAQATAGLVKNMLTPAKKRGRPKK